MPKRLEVGCYSIYFVIELLTKGLSMKKYIITSLLLFVPFISMATDHCTNPSEYTIDKRCYVTDEQKKEKPYNAVVGILNLKWNNAVVCTGTIAKWERGLTRKDSADWNSLLYLFTAKHCTDQNGDGMPDKSLRIELQNGDKFDVTLVGTGDYDINNDSNENGDWAVYTLPVDLIKDSSGKYHVNMVSAENMENKIPWIYADSDGVRDDRNIRLIGYGSLKIMSDREIEEFKQKYIESLKQNHINNMSYETTGILDDGGVDLSKLAVGPLAFSARYYVNLFGDKKLKVSRCYFKEESSQCQGWNGNSGGPMIDNLSRLVGILTRGNSYIGGRDHAGLSGFRYEDEKKKYVEDDIPMERIYKIMEGLIRIETPWNVKF